MGWFREHARSVMQRRSEHRIGLCLLGIALFALPVGCSDGAPIVPAETGFPVAATADSSGILIRTVSGDTAHLPLWRPEPSGARLGAVDCDCPEDFGSVAGAVLLSDGSIAVADNQARQVLFFSPDGTHLRSVGRRGAGPGEFDMLHSVSRAHGDDVAVWDTGLRRATIILADGSVRVVSLETPDPHRESPAPASIFRVFGLSEGRWVSVAEQVVLPPNTALQGPMTREVPADVVLHDRSGAVHSTLAAVPKSELLYPFQASDLVGRVGQATPYPDRRWHVSAAGDAIAVAHSDAFRISLYNAHRGLEQVLSYPALNTAYSDEEFARRRASALSPRDGRPVSEITHHIFAPEFKPQSRPVFSGFSTSSGSAGSLRTRTRVPPRPGSSTPR